MKDESVMTNFNPGNNSPVISNELTNLSEEKIYWLHEQLFFNQTEKRNMSNFGILKDECIKKLESDNTIEVDILSKLKVLEEISKQYFDWVADSNIRLIAWLQNEIKNEYPNPISAFSAMNNFKKKLFISKFSLSVQFNEINSKTHKSHNQSIGIQNSITLEQKIIFINQLNLSWDHYEKLTSKFLVWLEKLDKESLLWCYKYIKNKEEKFPYSSTINEISPTDVIILIDQINFTNDDAFTLYTERLKRSFAQHKYKSASKTKNKYHLPLTKQAKKILNELAEYRRQSESDVLEDLLMREYKQKMCDPQGNPKF